MKTSRKDSARIDRSSPEPGYAQLARVLAGQIAERRVEPGSQMPRERDLAMQYRVSRFMVRNALDVLEAQGLICRVQGRGTFVIGESSRRHWLSSTSTILLAHAGTVPLNPPPLNAYYVGILDGVRQAARTLGCHLRMHPVSGNVRVPMAEYKPPRPSEVGGVIVCGTFDEVYIGMFGSEGVPVVVVDFWSHNPMVDSVVVDVESEAYLAVDHLTQKGHASVGFVATARKEHGSSISDYDPDIWRFLDSLRRATQRRRIEMRDEWIRMPVNSGSQAYQAVRELLGIRGLPTSLICFDDSVAVAALKAIKDAGLRCPEDISVISRGAAEDAGCAITRLVNDPQMLGRQAVRVLVERMQNQRQQALKVAVATRLALGRTTGLAPSR